MRKVLPMIQAKAVRVTLGILLTTADIFVAFFLVLGGWNATNSHPITGYICMAFGPVLLYLSSGIWTKNQLKLAIRVALYAGAFVALGVSAGVLIAVHALPQTSDTGVFYIGIVVLLSAALLSGLHLRLVRQELSAALHA
jgi:hypothetical protein